jgi:hypothetical protein
MKKIFFLALLISILWQTTYGYIIHNRTVAEIPLENYYLKARIGSPLATVRQKNRELGASIGINGSFFCPAERAYNYCGANNSTSSDRIVAGVTHSKYPNDTGERGIIWVNANNEPLFVQNNNRQWYMVNTNQHRIGEIHYGIWNFPILIDNGMDVTLEMGHLIDSKMFNKGTRSFICIPESHDRVFMGFIPNKSIYEMGAYLKNTYGCHFAVNLDAWGSSAMVVDDRHIVWPWRRVVDGFVVIPKEHYIENKIQNHQFSTQQRASINRLWDMFAFEIYKKGDTYKQKILNTFQSRESSTLFYPLADKRALLREMINIIEQVEPTNEYGFIPYE